MNMDLATNGLPEFSLKGVAQTESLGGCSAEVQRSCEELYQHADAMKSFVATLEESQNSILSDWEGESARTLRMQFPALMSAFEEVSPVIRSIADWATDVMNNYEKADNYTAEKINSILGGM